MSPRSGGPRSCGRPWSSASTSATGRSTIPPSRSRSSSTVAAWSACTTYLATDRSRHDSASWPVIAIDLTAAAALVVGNAVVYAGPPEQTFGSAWPLTAAILTGISRGRVVGLVGGVSLGLLNVIVSGAVDPGSGSTWVGATGTSVLLGLGGWAAGFVTDRLRDAELEIAEARIREQFARTLHDGVLQTLAAVQRRSDDAGSRRGGSPPGARAAQLRHRRLRRARRRPPLVAPRRGPPRRTPRRRALRGGRDRGARHRRGGGGRARSGSVGGRDQRGEARRGDTGDLLRRPSRHRRGRVLGARRRNGIRPGIDGRGAAAGRARSAAAWPRWAAGRS